jgi:hypothetical protein
MKKVSRIILCIWSVMLFQVFQSHGETLFGPHQYVRATEGTTVFTDTFTTLAGHARLYIENGEWDSGHRVDNQISSARVFINGAQIYAPSDFNQNVHILETLVDLAQDNAIRVEFNGSPDSFLTSRVTRPSVTMTADQEIILLGDSSILSWESSDVETCAVEPGIGTVAVNGSTVVAPAETTVYTITVTDPVGVTAFAFQEIRVNRMPVAEPQSIATDEDLPVAVTLNGSDVDGDELSYQVVSGPLHGTLSGDSPDLVYSPNPNFNGYDTFSFVANDSMVDSDPAVIDIAITPINDPPVADALSITTDEDTPVAVSLTGTDVENDPLTFQVITDPVNGTLSGSAPDLTYTPNPDYHGSDSFTFTANDGALDSEQASATVTVNPVNDPPVADAGVYQSVFRGDTVNLDGSGSSDVDGDPLSFQWAIIASPTGSTATLSDPTSSVPTFVADVTGLYEVQLLVNDGTIDSPQAQITIIANPRLVTVSNVVGLPQADAEAAIASANLAIGGLSSAHHDTVPAGSVISQNPISGDTVEEFSQVDLVLSLGPETSLPTVSISAEPSGIFQGDSTVLTWAASNSSTIIIDNDIGPVAAAGSITVTPSETITYHITATGPEGTVTDQVTVFVLEPAFFETKLISGEPPAGGEQFAITVSISGDTAIVGNPRAYIGEGVQSGAAYIFKYDGSTWTKQAKLVAADTVHNDHFGWSVSISGDIAIIGARYDSDAGSASGSAYIFKYDGTNWTEQAKLVASDAEQGDVFGSSVGVDGNVAIVGAYLDDDAGGGSGSAYIFKYDNGNWLEQAKLLPADAAAGDLFGYSVSINGNLVVVCAPYHKEEVGGYTGAAYVFKYDGSTWAEQAKLIPEIAVVGGNFGNSSDISGDRAIVGAQGDKKEGFYSGSAYIFHYDGLSWTQQAKLTSDNTSAGNYFGSSVGINGDTVIVGAVGECDEFCSGVAYLFKYDGTNWTEQAKLRANGASDGDHFGRSVDMSGDTVIVGTYYADSAYIFKPQPVNVYFSAFPDLTPTGETTLTWYTQNATSVSIDNGIGTVEVNGSMAITVSETTSFTITASGTLGTVSANTTVTIGYPQPLVTFTAEPEIIPAGGSATLVWDTENVDSCMIEPGGIDCTNAGLVEISPAETTDYILTASGPGGSIQAGVTVSIEPEVSIAADPMIIWPSESSTLSWTSAHVDTCNIYPGPIDCTESNGSVVVWPVNNQTYYTVVGNGPAGTVTDSVTISEVPRASVSLNIAPEVLLPGESAILSWFTSNLDTCVIEPGAIDCSSSGGSTTVWPTENTTYTITGTNAGGSVSESVSVTFEPPTVSPTVDRAYIVSGQSVTLTWDITNAESVSIDNGIGNVGSNGSTTIFPSTTVTYTITAAGPGGTDIAAVTIKVLDADTTGVLLISPTENDVIDISQTLVTGLVATGAGEVGVTVNGYPAKVNGNMFFVNNLQLMEGENIITATATEPDGSTASDSVTVYVDTSITTDWIELTVNPEVGIAPLSVTLIANPHLANPIQSSAIAYDGTGEVAVVHVSDTEYELVFNTPGIYAITYMAVDDQGQEFSQDIMVNVLDREQLDTLLKFKWEGMKGALAAQDVEGGLIYFLESSQENYRIIFNIISPQLPQIISDMQAPEMIYAEDGRAKYRINRVHDFDGIPVTITYYIYFSVDETGQWKIEQF